MGFSPSSFKAPSVNISLNHVLGGFGELAPLKGSEVEVVGRVGSHLLPAHGSGAPSRLRPDDPSWSPGPSVCPPDSRGPTTKGWLWGWARRISENGDIPLTCHLAGSGLAQDEAASGASPGLARTLTARQAARTQCQPNDAVPTPPSPAPDASALFICGLHLGKPECAQAGLPPGPPGPQRADPSVCGQHAPHPGVLSGAGAPGQGRLK